MKPSDLTTLFRRSPLLKSLTIDSSLDLLAGLAQQYPDSILPLCPSLSFVNREYGRITLSDLQDFCRSFFVNPQYCINVVQEKWEGWVGETDGSSSSQGTSDETVELTGKVDRVLRELLSEDQVRVIDDEDGYEMTIVGEPLPLT